MSVETRGKRKLCGKEAIANKRFKSTRFTRDDVTKVLAGPDRTEFAIHESLLVEHGPFFAAKAKPCWQELEAGIDLKDISMEGFEFIAAWMYRKETLSDLSYESDGEPLGFDEFMSSFCTAYKAADQLLMTDLQDQLVDKLLQTLKREKISFGLGYLRLIADAALTHTPVYVFIIKSAVRYIMKESFCEASFDKNLQTLGDHPTILQEVIRYIGRYRKSPWDERDPIDPCEFHLHTKESRCPSHEV